MNARVGLAELTAAVAAAVALGALAVTGVGCANAPSTLVILQNQLVTPDMTTGVCTPTEDLDSALLSGTFDVDLDHDYPYLLHPLLESRLPSLQTADGIERNSLTLTALHIEIQAPAGVSPDWPAGCPATFDAPSPLVIDPQQTRALTVIGLEPCHSQHLRQLIKDGAIPASSAQPVYFTLAIQAIATRDGSTVESEVFPFPVAVCAGCLQAYFPATPMCIDTPKPNPKPGNPCNLAQDGPQVLCCVDAAGALLCPAPDL
jgi:hypothetical protein